MPFPKKPEETFDQLREKTKGNTSVTQPILRLSDSVVKKKSNSGRKKKYTPTRMKNEINKYFKWCEEKDQIPSQVGMMRHLKMHTDMFYKYREYEEYRDIMNEAQLSIAEWFARDVYNTKGVAAGKIAYLKNIHGWSEKTEQHIQSTQTVINVDQARARIEALAPRLLEVLKNSTVLNQLVYQEAELVKEEK